MLTQVVLTQSRLWNVLLPRYHLKYCLSWSCIQESKTSPQKRASLWCVVCPWGVVRLSFVGHAQACLAGLLAVLRMPRFVFSDALSAGDVALHALRVCLL